MIGINNVSNISAATMTNYKLYNAGCFVILYKIDNVDVSVQKSNYSTYDDLKVP